MKDQQIKEEAADDEQEKQQLNDEATHEINQTFSIIRNLRLK